MTSTKGLDRFIEAQSSTIEAALAELHAGQKRTHWMWFIFPQIHSLGRSPMAQFFAISSLEEARAYLAHPILGRRLRQCTAAALPWATQRSAAAIFGAVDALKFHSCMTLFDYVARHDVFERALRAFYGSAADEATLALLFRQR
ncbi:DUF1810 domain-containing protein [Sphingomonas flavescens]|uniref:DUF1810 domain-containing protein n=1 Tax=Sphingomonas flavescens TaxID=3132797 RepID=UPI0028046978|nr:DUF1810 domain-containing protein [Sphingomonas limnosediminicola]